MKIAVFYYSQTGQAYHAAKQLFRSVIETANREQPNLEVIYKQIVPFQQYPFPWNKTDFFDVFPETRLGIPVGTIQPLDLSDVTDAELVVVVGQSWFLSPSQPLQSFFTDESVKQYLADRDVIFVNVCRNMWLMTYQKVRKYLQEAQARMVGHIVLQDEEVNLISVLTIVRWLLYGRKETTGILPDAGVSRNDMMTCGRFGTIAYECIKLRQIETLQNLYYVAGAIHYKPSILFLEKTGHKIFGAWAKFIRRKGDYGDPRRAFRVNMFFYYLLFVLFVVSPFAQLFFYLTYPFRGVKRQAWNICHLLD